MENIKRLEHFVRSFDQLHDVGHLISFSPQYSQFWHHVDTMPCLQFMGFMPKEQFAPFFDIHIFLEPTETTNKVVRQLLKTAFSGKTDDEYAAWIMFTAWRKLKNNDPRSAQFIKHYIKVMFPEDYQTFAENPEDFFKQHNKPEKYQEVFAFLTH